MRSIPLLAATTVILAAAWSCGGGGTGVNVPVANFTVGSCVAGTACQFTNTSTPATGLTYEWTFSDAPTVKVSDPSPLHTFAAAGDYTVSLKVTDASAATNTKTTTVTVGAGTNTPPVASFDLPTGCTAGTPCGFHSTSTDPDVGGTIAASAWNFDDPTSANNTADTPDATHTFANPGTYTVALTVTDDKGAASTPATHDLIVSPAASQSCTTTLGTTVDCLLNITRAGQVKITLQSSQCELHDNKLTITAPVPQEAINNVCFQPDNTVVIVKDAAGQPRVFTVGEQLGIRFRRGQPGPADPPAGDPGIRVQGSYPNLVLNVDDGGNNAAPGEPDFNDAVLLIQQGP